MGKNTRYLLAVIVLAILGFMMISCTEVPTEPVFDDAPAFLTDGPGLVADGKVFTGLASCLDGDCEDGLYFGGTLFANDHLVVVWRDGGYQIHWNGRVPGGSNVSWLYKIVYLDYYCGLTGSPVEGYEGGYCLNGWSVVVMSHGGQPGEHFFAAHVPWGGGKMF